MTIEFILMVNKSGITRVARYFNDFTAPKKRALELSVLRECLKKNDKDAPFFEFEEHSVIFRRYASLFIIIGVRKESSTEVLMVHELIHLLVQIMDSFFQSVCEMDILNNIHFVYMIVDEVVSNGIIISTNKEQIINNVRLVLNN